MCWVYADEVAYVCAYEDAAASVELVDRSAARVDRALMGLERELGRTKRNNLALSPGTIVGPVFRRGNKLAATANKELPVRDRRFRELVAAIPAAALPADVLPSSLRDSLPYNYKTQFRVLGLELDETFGFEAEVENAIGRAMVRQRVMTQLARRTWGLEAGLLRSTHAALVTSLIGYGLVITGSHAYEGLMSRLETQYANIAARRITAVSRAAQLEVLRPMADILSVRNMYVQQCALLMDRALREHASLLQDRVGAYLRTVCRVEKWTEEVAGRI